MRAHRQRAGLSQKALALTVGIDQARLCELERGRRSPQPGELLGRLAEALVLSVEQRQALIWTAEHDRLIREVAQGPCAVATDLVSAALWATPALSSPAREGLTKLLTSKAVIDAELRQLDALSGSTAPVGQGVPMT